MSENKAALTPAEEYYIHEFTPAVHRIGRFTMGVAFILSFLPVIYFYFVKGYQAPVATYISGFTAVSAIGIGMWLTEPLVYWPILGSAGTYIAYLSGNVGGMRFPVAVSVQKMAEADITTPRGQIVTITGIVASVVANLVILLCVVIVGEWILNHLPAPVRAALGFVMVSMMAANMLMRLNMNGGPAKALPKVWPYMLSGVIGFFAAKYVAPLKNWGMCLAVGIAVLVGYFKYRQDKAAAGE
ncbi:MAG: hypothetical protein IIZ27_01415 [Solobacterium sp.]|nr:hypothetical protein [Solobacterium sp.]